MCQDAEVRLILSEDNRVMQAMPSFKGEVFTSDALNELPASDIPLPEPLSAQRYVILYTSGSTGRPKGVAIEYHNIVNFCHSYIGMTGLTSQDRVTAHAAFGFDCHMLELYPALCTGASVYVIPTEMRLDIEGMDSYFNQNGISIAFMTTQVGYLFATTINNQRLRLLCVAGRTISSSDSSGLGSRFLSTFPLGVSGNSSSRI